MRWYLKQLLPLTYWTFYGDQQGRTHFVIWRMWFGRCFDECDVIVLRAGHEEEASELERLRLVS